MKAHHVLLLLPRRDFLPSYETLGPNLEIVRIGTGIPTNFSSKRFIGTFFDFFSNNIDFLLGAWAWLHKGDNIKKIDLIHAHSDGIFGYSLRNGHVLKNGQKNLWLSHFIKR